MAKSTPVADIEQLADRIATILTLTADAYSTASVAAANIRELADEPAYAVIDVLDDHGDALHHIEAAMGHLRDACRVAGEQQRAIEGP